MVARNYFPFATAKSEQILSIRTYLLALCLSFGSRCTAGALYPGTACQEPERKSLIRADKGFES
eukprot:874821-Rhodomonas_salina.1